ncbi:MAG: carbonic anhydrase [Saprospiraceae bacterium]|nr:carbonic anhydrase [Saprospiraceae bacterium]
MRTLTKEMQDNITPALALELLRRGNHRFVNNLKLHRNLLEQVNETKSGQHPFAVILSCMDSRTSAELIFDQGLGDIFSIRIAGNILNEDIVGSMEFACKVAGAKIILVLGHTKCGAVKGACDGVKLGNLTPLLRKIEPAIINTSVTSFEVSNSYAFVDAVATNNVHFVMDELAQASPILSEMVHDGSIAIVGGMYNIETGKVDLFEHEHISHLELSKEELSALIA